MKHPHVTYTSRARRGATLVEAMIACTVLVVISTAVFVGLSHFSMISAQDAMYHALKEDMLLTMDRLRRDVQHATNVVPKVGTRTSDNICLVLRQPVQDNDGRVIQDQFRYVVYTHAAPGYGLLREVWTSLDAQAPAESEVLNESIVALGFQYGGQTIQDISNLVVVRDVETLLVVSRETGLRKKSGDVTADDYLSEDTLVSLMRYGAPFVTLRYYLDTINAGRLDIAMAASTGSASMRNRRALGLKGIQPPEQAEPPA